MNANTIIQYGAYLLLLLAVTKPMGIFIARVMEGKSFANKIGGPIERLIYRMAGVNASVVILVRSYLIRILCGW